MKNLTVLATLLLVFVSTGQADQSADDPDPASVRTIEVDQMQERDGLIYEAGSQEPFTGKAVYYHDYQKDHLATEIDVVNGKPHGYATEYYTDGSKKGEMKLVDGEEMDSITWHRNGQKESEETWVDGKRIVEHRWNKSGELQETFYYPGTLEFEQKRQEVDGEDPVEPGSTVRDYKVRGYRYFFVTWHKNGQQRSEKLMLTAYHQRIKMSHTLSHGQSVSWYANGRKSAETVDHYGREKSKVSWYSNGQKHCEAYRDSFDEVLQVKGWDAEGNEREYPQPEFSLRDKIYRTCDLRGKEQGF